MADQIKKASDKKFNASTPIPTKPIKSFSDSAYSSFCSPLRTNLEFENSPDISSYSNLILDHSPQSKMAASNEEDELMRFFENIDLNEIQNQNEPYIRRSMRSPAWYLRPKSAPLNEENESDLDDEDRPTFSLSLADESVSNQGIHEDILIHSEEIEVYSTGSNNKDDNDATINTSTTQVKRRVYKSRDINDNHVSSCTTTSNTLTSHSASSNGAGASTSSSGFNRRHRFSITEDDLRKELIAIKLRSLAEKCGNGSGFSSRSGNRSGLAQNREYLSEMEISSMATSNSASRSSCRNSYTTNNLSGLATMPSNTTQSSSSSSSLSAITRTLFSSHYTGYSSSAPQPRHTVGSSSPASFTEMMPNSCGYTLDLVYSLYRIYKLHRHVHRHNDSPNNRNSLPNCDSMASMTNNNNASESCTSETRVNYRIRSLTE